MRKGLWLGDLGEWMMAIEDDGTLHKLLGSRMGWEFGELDMERWIAWNVCQRATRLRSAVLPQCSFQQV